MYCMVTTVRLSTNSTLNSCFITRNNQKMNNTCSWMPHLLQLFKLLYFYCLQIYIFFSINEIIFLPLILGFLLSNLVWCWNGCVVWQRSTARNIQFNAWIFLCTTLIQGSILFLWNWKFGDCDFVFTFFFG